MVPSEASLYAKIGTSYHKKRRGRIALFLTIILSSAVLLLPFLPVNTTPNIDVTNREGYISTKIAKGMFTLNGEWLFYPETVLDPGRRTPLSSAEATLQELPGIWNQVMDGPEGYGSYVCRLFFTPATLRQEKNERFEMYINSAGTSFHI
mgnify:CR=1 FL=1